MGYSNRLITFSIRPSSRLTYELYTQWPASNKQHIYSQNMETRNTPQRKSLTTLDNCSADAILKVQEELKTHGSSLEPGKYMIVTYDEQAGLTRAAFFNSAHDILVKSFEGMTEDAKVKTDLLSFRNSIPEEHEVRFVNVACSSA